MKAKLQRQGFALSKTSGRSMRPLIWGGEHCVAVAPIDGEPSIGDLLMFRIKQPDGTGKSIVHRLVEIREVNALTSFEPQSLIAEALNTEGSHHEPQSLIAEALNTEKSYQEPQSSHRETRLYITRGDNCIGYEVVKREEIIGKITEVHRISGWRPWHIIPRKKFAVTDGSYRLYSRIWAAIWPLRRLLYRIRGKHRLMCSLRSHHNL